MKLDLARQLADSVKLASDLVGAGLKPIEWDEGVTVHGCLT